MTSYEINQIDSLEVLDHSKNTFSFTLSPVIIFWKILNELGGEPPFQINFFPPKNLVYFFDFFNLISFVIYNLLFNKIFVYKEVYN